MGTKARSAGRLRRWTVGAVALCVMAAGVSGAGADPGQPAPRLESKGAGTTGTTTAGTWQGLFALPLAAAGGERTWDTTVTTDGRYGLTVSGSDVRQYALTRSAAKYLGRTTAAYGTTVVARPGHSYAYVLDRDDLHVLDVRTAAPKKVRTLAGSYLLRDAAVTADGKILYVAYGSSMSSNKGLRVYSLATPSKPRWLRTIPLKGISPSAISLNRQGTRLAVGYNLVGKVELFSTSTPSLPRSLGSPTAMPGDNSVSAMTFSTGGTALYVVGTDHPYLTTIDVAGRRVSHNQDYGSTFGVYTDGVDLAMTKSGTYLYMLLDGQQDNKTVAIINRSSRSLAGTFTGVMYPRGLSVSQAGSSLDNGYFATTTSWSQDGYYLGFGNR